VEASVVSDGRQLTYPTTMVWFVFGVQDYSVTAAHGRHFLDRLRGAHTPLVGLDIVPETGHVTAATAQGANTLRDVLLRECHPR